MKELLNTVSGAEWKDLALPPLAALDSGVLEISSREPIERECSAEGRFRGGKGDRSVSLVSWARVSFKRRRLRLLLGVLRDSSDTDFLKSGLSDCRQRKLHSMVYSLCPVQLSAEINYYRHQPLREAKEKCVKLSFPLFKIETAVVFCLTKSKTVGKYKEFSIPNYYGLSGT